MGSLALSSNLFSLLVYCINVIEELIVIAKTKSFSSDTKAGEIADWLKHDFDLGRCHAMALVHVIKNGPKIDAKHVGSKGTHRDESDMLRLDGIKNR